MADNVIQNIGIKATADTGDTVKKLNELSNGLKKVYESAKGIDTKGMSFGQLRQGLQQAQASLRSAEKDIVKYGNTMGQMWRSAKVEEADAKGRIDAFSSALKSLEKQASGMKISIWNEGTPTSSEKYPFGKEEEYTPTQYKFAPIDPSLVGGQGLDQTNAKAEETISKFSRLRAKIGEAFSQENLQNFSDKMSRISAKAGSISDKMGRVAKTVGSAGKRFMSAINPMKMFRNEENKLSLSSTLLGKAFSRLGRMFRIMVTRMLIRGFISNIREGFQNIAKYSDVVNQKFSAIISSAKTLYNAFASAFTPLIEAIAPYVVKALDFITSAMNKVAEFLSALTGKSYFIKATKYQTNYAKSLDKTGKSAGKTAKKVKELKSATIGIDKLNVIEKKQPDTSNSGSGSGAGGGGASANDMFDTKPVSKKMKDLAKEVKKIAKKLFDPIQKAWNSKGAKVLGSMKKMLGSIWETIKDIGRDFLTMWQQPATVKIFEDILDTVATIFDIVTAISDQFRKAWNKDNVGLHIFENLRDVVGIVVRRIKKCAEYTRDWAKHLNFTPLLKSIERYTKSLKKLVKGLSDIAGDFYETVVLGISKWVVEKGLPNLIQVFTDFNNKVDWQSLRKSLKVVWEGVEKFGEAVGQGLIDFIGWLADGIKDLLNAKWFKDFLEAIGNALKKINPTIVKRFLQAWLGFKAVKFVSGIFGNIATKIGWVLGKVRLFRYSTIGGKIVSAFSGIGSKIGSVFSGIGTKISGLVTSIGGLSTIMGSMAGAIGGVAVMTAITLWVDSISAGKVEAGYLNDEEEKYLDKLDKANEKLATQKQKQEEVNSSLLTSKDNAIFYKDELGKIVDKNGKIKEGYETQAQFLVEQLNPYLDDDMKIVGDTVTGWKNQNKQIEKQIGLITAKNTLEKNGQSYYDAKQNIGKSAKDLMKASGLLNKTRKGAKGNALIPQGAFSDFLVDNSKAGKAYKKTLKNVEGYYQTIIRNEALRKAITSGNDKAIEKANMQMNKGLTKAEKLRLAQLVNYSEKTGKDLTSVIENDLSTNVTNFGSAFKNAKNKGNTAFAKISEASTKNKNKISGNLDKTKTKASTTFGNIKKDSNTKLNGIKDRNVKIKGNNDDAKKKIDDTKKKLTFKDKTVNLFVNIVATIKEKIGKLAEVFKKVIKAFGYSVGDWLGFTTKSGKKKTKKIEKTHRAIGGFPKLGSMFIAGEKGAELVGEINHKSGVASQGEITGIRDSIETSSAVQNKILLDQNALLKELINKETDVNIDGVKLTKKINKINARSGCKMATT